MTEMQVFQNSEFGELGVLEIEGKPYFPATACAKKLGYVNPRKAIIDHCKGVNEMVTPTKGGTQAMRFIPEGDLYRLIIHSKLPAAAKFERWVFDEVLPTIRKQGAYGPELAGLTKLAEQLATVVAGLGSVVEKMNISPTTEQTAIFRRPRKATSIISRLDLRTRREVEDMICSGRYTYAEIARHLSECYDISISVASVCRYAQSLEVSVEDIFSYQQPPHLVR